MAIEIRQRDDQFVIELTGEKWLVPFDEINNMKMLEDGLIECQKGGPRFCGSYEIFFELKKILITIPRLTLIAKDKHEMFSVISALIDFKDKYGKFRQAVENREVI